MAFECDRVSVERIPYREVLPSIPDLTYPASFRLIRAKPSAPPTRSLACLPDYRSLSGWAGRSDRQQREVTEREEQILESVVRIVGRELQTKLRPGVVGGGRANIEMRRIHLCAPSREGGLGSSVSLRGRQRRSKAHPRSTRAHLSSATNRMLGESYYQAELLPSAGDRCEM